MAESALIDAVGRRRQRLACRVIGGLLAPLLAVASWWVTKPGRQASAVNLRR